VAFDRIGYGRLTVAFGGDGGFLFNPGTLWMAAHHRIPMLYIVRNNRAYHQEYMYLQAKGRPSRPWYREGGHRHNDQRSECRLCHRGAGAWARPAKARLSILTISHRHLSAPSAL